MGSKKINNFLLMSATALSGTATVHSPIKDVQNVDNLGLQVSFVGTMTGTLSVEGSVDKVNFDALTFNPVLGQPAGSATRYLIDINQFPWPWLRVSYTNSSGSGTLTVGIFSKDLN